MAAFSKSSTILVNENGLGFNGVAAAATAAPDVVDDGAVNENPGVSVFFDASVVVVAVVLSPFDEVLLVVFPNTNGAGVVESVVAAVVDVDEVAVEVAVDVVAVVVVVAGVPNENPVFRVVAGVVDDDDSVVVAVAVEVVPADDVGNVVDEPNENPGFVPVEAVLLSVVVVLPKLNVEAGVVVLLVLVEVLVGVVEVVEPKVKGFAVVVEVEVEGVELEVLNVGIEDEPAAAAGVEVLKEKADVNVEACVVAGVLVDDPACVVAAPPLPKLKPGDPVVVAVVVGLIFVDDPKLNDDFAGCVVVADEDDVDGLLKENADPVILVVLALVFKFCCCG